MSIYVSGAVYLSKTIAKLFLPKRARAITVSFSDLKGQNSNIDIALTSLSSLPKITKGFISTVHSKGLGTLRNLQNGSLHLAEACQLSKIDSEDLETVNGFFKNLVALLSENRLQSAITAYNEQQVNYIEALTASIVSQIISYREKIVGNQIMLPFHDKDSWTLVSYTIKEFTVGNNLPIFILQSEDSKAANWIVPRGTSTLFGLRKGSLESLKTDFIQKEGIDLSAIENAKSIIKDELSKLQGPLIVAGHSLGGVFALKLAIDYKECISSVYTFGAPGVDTKTKEQYEKSETKIPIFGFVTQGDIIWSAGQHILGRLFLLLPSKNKTIHPLDRHISIFLNSDHTIQEIDPEKEEKSTRRFFIEHILRKNIANLLFQFR